MTTSRTVSIALTVGLIGALLGLALLLAFVLPVGGNGDTPVGAASTEAAPSEQAAADAQNSTDGDTAVSTTADTSQPAPAAGAGTSDSTTSTTAGSGSTDSNRIISDSEAGQIAAAHLGGTVDDIERESSYGAAWDVDVYAPDGDYTVYVSATGEIVRVDGPW